MFPGAQGTHVELIALSVENDIAWHSPLTADNPVPAQYFPAGQGLQLLCPAKGCICPAAHCLQCFEQKNGEKEPAAQFELDAQ